MPIELDSPDFGISVLFLQNDAPDIVGQRSNGNRNCMPFLVINRSISGFVEEAVVVIKVVVQCDGDDALPGDIEQADRFDHVMVISKFKPLQPFFLDDGCGFDRQQLAGGFGLQNMQERVDRLGGTLNIISAPGRGTEISVKAGLADERFA